jgi:sensor histidine kinase regulating citrate/malate metabolism
LVEENISFLKENIKALENTFSDYEEKINLLEESGSYSALELKKAMKSIFTSFNNVTSIADFSENDRTLYFDSLKKDVDLARHEIEKIRGIVKSHQHSFHEIANEVVKEVQAEKRSEMESLSIDVELIVEGEGYPKNIYYDEYFIWKSILLNLLRNGIESVAMALEEDTLPPQRRVVLLRLSRRDTGRVRTTIEVEDRGCGMDEDTKKWMFKRGFTQGKEAGTGQGLTEEMKDFLLKRGSLKIESLSGVGTKIRIEC